MHIAVIGAGIMGADIAQAVALGGYAVILLDTDERTLRLALARISRQIDQGIRLGKVESSNGQRARRVFEIATSLDRCAPADLVIEAVHDNLALKQSIFQALDDIVRADTILATTTDTLSVTALARATRLPERVIGLHFFNPAHLIRLVEIARGDQTRPDVADRAVDFVRVIGKTPVIVPNLPGLIVNRVAQTYVGEALRLLDDSSLDVPTIDRLMEAAGFPMGPFRLMDFLGVDRVLDITQALYEATFRTSRFRPHIRQQQMVEAGRLGRKTGRGFYQESG